eukprot:CAMPEP_0174883032 /NCGR_PEP_ID=MMETSP1114-20130205/85058_1 /TAXON_ID=312471 /ORGANISM="Neobodo designis, Strain CCAP 1951/1" /LENGTH=294 /DNA_ID=CAMNT_0016118433 /DNA_START=588 /DNA_END=1474 /DNA_ORIENTATION=-
MAQRTAGPVVRVFGGSARTATAAIAQERKPRALALTAASLATPGGGGAFVTGRGGSVSRRGLHQAVLRGGGIAGAAEARWPGAGDVRRGRRVGAPIAPRGGRVGAPRRGGGHAAGAGLEVGAQGGLRRQPLGHVLRLGAGHAAGAGLEVGAQGGLRRQPLGHVLRLGAQLFRRVREAAMKPHGAEVHAAALLVAAQRCAVLLRAAAAAERRRRYGRPRAADADDGRVADAGMGGGGAEVGGGVAGLLAVRPRSFTASGVSRAAGGGGGGGGGGAGCVQSDEANGVGGGYGHGTG